VRSAAVGRGTSFSFLAALLLSTAFPFVFIVDCIAFVIASAVLGRRAQN
jgi:hypothetical protein